MGARLIEVTPRGSGQRRPEPVSARASRLSGSDRGGRLDPGDPRRGAVAGLRSDYATAVQDLAAGQIDLWFGTADQLPLVRAGSIKAYAAASDARMAVAPDIPTFGEMGLPAVSFSAWVGLFAPKGTPKEIIGKLNAAAVGALADPAVRSRFVGLGLEIFPREQQTPEALGALVKADAEKRWPIIKKLGIKPE